MYMFLFSNASSLFILASHLGLRCLYMFLFSNASSLFQSAYFEFGISFAPDCYSKADFLLSLMKRNGRKRNYKETSLLITFQSLWRELGDVKC